MAEFDPIEFVGIGYDRDISFDRHARARSQSSISLPSDGGHTASSQWPWQKSVMPSSVAEEPYPSYHHSNITPEGSVLGLTYGLTDISPAASPNVSSNSSWAADDNRPCSIYRYAHNHERHEELAISLSAVPEAGHQWTVKTAAADGRHSFAKPQDAVARGLSHSDAPMHRYMAVVQAHEFLAFALESSSQQDQPTQQLQLTPQPPEPTKEPPSTLLTLYVPGVDALEDGEDIEVTEEATRLTLQQRRREKSQRQPRQPKGLRKNKRSDVSPQPGHKDKMPRWS